KFALSTLWLLLATVSPETPVPLLAPPAASTVPTVPLVVLPPAWATAVAVPVEFVAAPVVVTVLVLLLPLVVIVVVARPMPSPFALPLTATAKSSFSEATDCSLDATVSPPAPEPLLAPPAASTVPTLPVVALPPFWPTAAAAPVVLVTVPRLVTVFLLVPLPFLMVVVTVLMPSPTALPLTAMASSLLSERTDWVLLAVVSPDEPEPLLAPPAASTVPTLPLVRLLPFWPVADAVPVLLTAVPVLLTTLVALPVLVSVVVSSPMPSPKALPLTAMALPSLRDATDWLLEAVVSPLELEAVNDAVSVPLPRTAV